MSPTASQSERKGLNRINPPSRYRLVMKTAGPEPIDLPKTMMFFI